MLAGLGLRAKNKTEIHRDPETFQEAVTSPIRDRRRASETTCDGLCRAGRFGNMVCGDLEIATDVANHR